MNLSRVVLAPAERKELERRARSRSLAVELVKRAKVILMLAAGLHRSLHQPLEGALQARTIGRVGFALPRRQASPSHCADRSAHSGTDPARTDRRIDPLEQLSACEGVGGQSVDGQSGVAAIWVAAPPFAQL